MAPPKIFVFSPNEWTGECHRKLEDAGCRLVLGSASWHTPHGNNEDEMCRLAEASAGLMGSSIRSSPISRRILESSDALRIVAKYTVGIDDVDVDAATELGIMVTHAPTEANCGGVAEGTIAMILAVLKNIREKDASMKLGQWRDRSLDGTYLGARKDGYPGITVGIIGLGRIGGRVADLLAPWGVRIIASDPYIDKGKFARHGAEEVDLPTLLGAADVVSLHVILTQETRGMIDAAQFAMMKPTAVLINTSRGQAVKESALAEALAADRIAGAAVDVFEDEPLATDSPLLALGNKVLLSPHMVSFNRGTGLHPGAQWATRSVLTALGGGVPDNVYNKEVIGRWEERFGGQKLLSAAAE
jgi:phosphoglycerate dehydrogenase-like enzyme